jgi:hypothetical protein
VVKSFFKLAWFKSRDIHVGMITYRWPNQERKQKKKAGLHHIPYLLGSRKVHRDCFQFSTPSYERENEWRATMLLTFPAGRRMPSHVSSWTTVLLVSQVTSGQAFTIINRWGSHSQVLPLEASTKIPFLFNKLFTCVSGHCYPSSIQRKSQAKMSQLACKKYHERENDRNT